jgi:hypothetical protein
MDDDLELNPGWPGDKRYAFAAITLWLIFLAAICVVQWGIEQHWSTWILRILSALPAISVAITCRLAWRLIASQDEFLRALTVKRMVAAAGTAITLVTLFSVGAATHLLPYFPAWTIWPLFWGLLGVMTPLIRTTGR